MRPISRGACSILAASLATAMTFAAGMVSGGSVAEHPGRFDANCNGGRGIQLREPHPSDFLADLAIRLTSGVELVGLDYLSAGSRQEPFVIEAVNPNCTIDRKFGTGGMVTLSLPKSAPAQFQSQIDAMAPGVNGNVILFGNTWWSWIATELTPTGQIDRAFGKNGWLVLKPYGFDAKAQIPPAVTSLVQEPNGRILVGGDAGEPHCCVHPFVYAFNANGHVDTAFGTHGHTFVYSVGAYVDQVILGSGGTIYGVGSLGFGGFGGMQFVALNRNGAIERAVTANLNRTQATLPKHTYYGGLSYRDREGGIGLIGSGSFQDQRTGIQTSPFAFSELHLPNGSLVRGDARTYDVPPGSYVQGAALPSGPFIVGTLNEASTVLVLHEILTDGSVNPRYGLRGGLSVRLVNPFGNSTIFTSDPILTPGGSSGDVDVIVSETKGPKLLEVIG